MLTEKSSRRHEWSSLPSIGTPRHQIPIRRHPGPTTPRIMTCSFVSQKIWPPQSLLHPYVPCNNVSRKKFREFCKVLESVMATTWPRFSSCFLCTKTLEAKWSESGIAILKVARTRTTMIWSQDVYADTHLACTTPPDLRYCMLMMKPFPSQIAMHSLRE